MQFPDWKAAPVYSSSRNTRDFNRGIRAQDSRESLELCSVQDLVGDCLGDKGRFSVSVPSGNMVLQGGGLFSFMVKF